MTPDQQFFAIAAGYVLVALVAAVVLIVRWADRRDVQARSKR